MTIVLVFAVLGLLWLRVVAAARNREIMARLDEELRRAEELHAEVLRLRGVGR
jgi:hypothetical protein